MILFIPLAIIVSQLVTRAHILPPSPLPLILTLIPHPHNTPYLSRYLDNATALLLHQEFPKSAFTSQQRTDGWILCASDHCPSLCQLCQLPPGLLHGHIRTLGLRSCVKS